MKRQNHILFLIASVTIILQGCRSLNPSVMLKTGRGFQYSIFPAESSPVYKIALNDEVSFNIFSNDGFKLVDVTTLSSEGSNNAIRTSNMTGALKYKVEFDGTVKLPLLGHVALKGMTIREAEIFLEEKYSAFYNKPYVLIEITNRRVIVFPGSAGSAKVVPLANENTTLLEGLATAGGIALNGKAYKVKLIRGDLKNPQVYLIDLSTIEGVKKADLILQANDIIYVEPKLRIGNDVMAQVLPYLSFVTTIILFVEFFKRVP
ncbi:MAG: polysaccharide biosynthesis/export family protein [Bacteroidetes bacterium]|nr:polysaccharide biosynthesis/export family protein [Bacteroidota bacterium]